MFPLIANARNSRTSYSITWQIPQLRAEDPITKLKLAGKGDRTPVNKHLAGAVRSKLFSS